MEKTQNSFQYAFLDSGSGGLPYLAQLRERAPRCSCVYVADTAHFPYGEKTRDEVISFAVKTVGTIIERFSPQEIIVACNTISVASLSVLRQTYPIPFVGTVPAIKLAAAYSKNRKIGLLATERTVSDPYTDNLIAQYASDCNVMRIGDSVLISKIEANLITGSAQERFFAVAPSIERFRAAGVDTIVLACTHFLHVIDEIHRCAGDAIHIIDSRDGVVQQALRLVPVDNSYPAKAEYYITGEPSPETIQKQTEYAKIFDISWGGIL